MFATSHHFHHKRHVSKVIISGVDVTVLPAPDWSPAFHLASTVSTVAQTIPLNSSVLLFKIFDDFLSVAVLLFLFLIIFSFLTLF